MQYIQYQVNRAETSRVSHKDRWWIEWNAAEMLLLFYFQHVHFLQKSERENNPQAETAGVPGMGQRFMKANICGKYCL